MKELNGIASIVEWR